MPIYSRLAIKNNTTVSYILSNENINPIQKKIACVFDTNGDGIYTDKEVTLFNATSSNWTPYTLALPFPSLVEATRLMYSWSS